MSRDVQESYESLAGIYDRRWRRYIDATLDLAMEGTTFEGTERVLDVACGTGELERRLLRRWPRLVVVGADLTASMLQHARAKPGLADLPWLQADVSRLPFSERAFDVLFCVSSFHYFRRPASSLDEMFRVLRPGGRLVLVDWCDDYLSCRLCSLWLRWTDPAFYRTYGLRECAALLEQSGFRVADTRRVRFGIWGLMRLRAYRDGMEPPVMRSSA